MTTNRLSTPNETSRGCPPDMPKGDSEADKAARQRYWIERGNANLAASGMHHLQWVCLGGYYTIEDRY